MRRALIAKLAFVALAAAVLLLVPATGVDAAPLAAAQAHTAATEEPEAQHASSQEPDSHAPAQEQDDYAATPQDAHAEDDHGEDEHAAEPKEWWYWPSKWINFILLVALLWWMLVVPPAAIQDIFSFAGLKTILRERAAAIIAAKELAAQQKEEAGRLLTDSEERLAMIEDEVAALVATARSDAEQQNVRSVEEGKRQADKILQIAEREVNSERLTAQRQLRGFVADLAVKMAENSLEEHLTADDQDRLIRDYLSRLGDSMA